MATPPRVSLALNPGYATYAFGGGDVCRGA
jgi:hypothetical protein